MTLLQKPPASRKGEPLWEITQLFPYQGYWSEDDYLDLDTNHLIEFSQGHLEILSMPAPSHQFIVLFLSRLLAVFVETHQLGWVLVAPTPVYLWPGKYREPDVFFIAENHPEKIQPKYCEGADLVMEVVSSGKEDRRRDLVTKRKEYAKAGIAEYWVIDPEQSLVTVFKLDDTKYIVHGEFGTGSQATSLLLEPFSVNVDDIFSSAKLPSVK